MDKLKADALLNPLLYPPDFDDVPPPFMSWNESSNTATLYSRADLFNTANQPTALNPLIEIMIDNFNGAKTRQGLFGQQTERFIATPQEYSTISEWSPGVHTLLSHCRVQMAITDNITTNISN
mmetsp:Transcript_3727/g.5644  ORF Transcript_3727/g.5644 Transcript_3727/m.5644 type:complete len:123 (-) Transcript_3727:1401-1769(-)